MLCLFVYLSHKNIYRSGLCNMYTCVLQKFGSDTSKNTQEVEKTERIGAGLCDFINVHQQKMLTCPATCRFQNTQIAISPMHVYLQKLNIWYCTGKPRFSAPHEFVCTSSLDLRQIAKITNTCNWNIGFVWSAINGANWHMCIQLVCNIRFTEFVSSWFIWKLNTKINNDTINYSLHDFRGSIFKGQHFT